MTWLSKADDKTQDLTSELDHLKKKLDKEQREKVGKEKVILVLPFCGKIKH